MENQIVTISGVMYNLSDLEDLSNWADTPYINDVECITKVAKIFDVPVDTVKIEFLPTCDEYCIWVGDEWVGYYNPLTGATTIEAIDHYNEYTGSNKLNKTNMQEE